MLDEFHVAIGEPLALPDRLAGRPRLVRVDPEPGVGRGLADRVDQLAVSVGPELDLEDRVAGIDRGLGLLTDALRLVESDRVGGRGRGRGVEPPETVEGDAEPLRGEVVDRDRDGGAGGGVAVDDGRQFGLDLVERVGVADALDGVEQIRSTASTVSAVSP